MIGVFNVFVHPILFLFPKTEKGAFSGLKKLDRKSAVFVEVLFMYMNLLLLLLAFVVEL